ncbi:MAG: hypothetical protein LBT42_00845 [Tannerella sp.]|jgi:hypothetical protein|nr:hypothetical protein [Tannerella sp.]
MIKNMSYYSTNSIYPLRSLPDAKEETPATEAGVLHDGTMEAGDHFKNGANPKSLMSKGNLALKFFVFITVFISALAISSCMGKEYPELDPELDSDKPAAPTGITATKDGNTVKVSWKGSPKATLYVVYRSKEANGAYDNIGSTTNTYFIDRNPFGSNNYYKIKAFLSDFSSEFSEYAYFNFANGKPTGKYIGIIGFNESLKVKDISLLNESTRLDFESFISGMNRKDGTVLYYAVDNAIDMLEKEAYPDDLVNVSIITFTDGLDQGSLALNSGYKSHAEYLNAVNNRIKYVSIKGVNITAYSIGFEGNDVSDKNQFDQNILQLADNPDHKYKATNIGEVLWKFEEIAASLYHKSISRTLSIKIPILENGTKIRFTFDNVTDAANSTIYIEGTYSSGAFKNIVYKGVRSSSGTTVNGTVAGIFVTFSFNNMTNNSGGNITINENIIKEWYIASSTSTTWQKNSEFDPKNDIQTIIDRKSAAIILVLDCSASLGNDFRLIKESANAFIDMLLDGETNGNNGSGGTYTQVRFKKDGPYQSYPKMGIADVTGTDIDTIWVSHTFGDNSGISPYYTIPAGVHATVFYYWNLWTFHYSDDKSISAYDFLPGHRYTVTLYQSNGVFRSQVVDDGIYN